MSLAKKIKKALNIKLYIKSDEKHKLQMNLSRNYDFVFTNLFRKMRKWPSQSKSTVEEA